MRYEDDLDNPGEGIPELPEPSEGPDAYPCPVCGGQTFSWGVPLGYRRIYFRAEGTTLGDSKRLYARACHTCGNVLLFLRREY